MAVECRARIIDRDIEFYDGCIENYERMLRTCETALEPHYRNLIVANLAVVRTLRHLRVMLDKSIEDALRDA